MYFSRICVVSKEVSANKLFLRYYNMYQIWYNFPLCDQEMQHKRHISTIEFIYKRSENTQSDSSFMSATTFLLTSNTEDTPSVFMSIKEMLIYQLLSLEVDIQEYVYLCLIHVFIYFHLEWSPFLISIHQYFLTIEETVSTGQQTHEITEQYHFIQRSATGILWLNYRSRFSFRLVENVFLFSNPNI